jgi:hypothetical protein
MIVMITNMGSIKQTKKQILQVFDAGVGESILDSEVSCEYFPGAIGGGFFPQVFKYRASVEARGLL